MLYIKNLLKEQSDTLEYVIADLFGYFLNYLVSHVN